MVHPDHRLDPREDNSLGQQHPGCFTLFLLLFVLMIGAGVYDSCTHGRSTTIREIDPMAH
ncbi:MAG: hypothetical protein U0487_03930 [Patescibacteria group bacterium]